YFLAPSSGRVAITVGGGVCDPDRTDWVILAPQVYKGNINGDVVLAAAETNRGYSSLVEASEYVYGSRTSLLTGLTPGEQYYAEVMFQILPGFGSTANGTAAINSREIII